jgi:tRNA uridine 5-carboxymethylaminomethyl modification enzyme
VRRYCPSLETKFARFPGRTHHVWLEPEGLDSHVLYPNGLSNSLEPEDQLRLLKTVPGESEIVKCAEPWYLQRAPSLNEDRCRPSAALLK